MKSAEEITTETLALAARSAWDMRQTILAAIEADRAHRDEGHLTLAVTSHPEDTLFFRETLAEAELGDGTKLELALTVGGGALVFQLHPKDAPHWASQTIPTRDLFAAWADIIIKENAP